MRSSGGAAMLHPTPPCRPAIISVNAKPLDDHFPRLKNHPAHRPSGLLRSNQFRQALRRKRFGRIRSGQQHMFGARPPHQSVSVSPSITPSRRQMLSCDQTPGELPRSWGCNSRQNSNPYSPITTMARRQKIGSTILRTIPRNQFCRGGVCN